MLITDIHKLGHNQDENVLNIRALYKTSIRSPSKNTGEYQQIPNGYVSAHFIAMRCLADFYFSIVYLLA